MHNGSLKTKKCWYVKVICSKFEYNWKCVIKYHKNHEEGGKVGFTISWAYVMRWLVSVCLRVDFQLPQLGLNYGSLVFLCQTFCCFRASPLRVDFLHHMNVKSWLATSWLLVNWFTFHSFLIMTWNDPKSLHFFWFCFTSLIWATIDIL